MFLVVLTFFDGVFGGVCVVVDITAWGEGHVRIQYDFMMF